MILNKFLINNILKMTKSIERINHSANNSFNFEKLHDKNENYVLKNSKNKRKFYSIRKHANFVMHYFTHLISIKHRACFFQIKRKMLLIFHIINKIIRLSI